MSSLIYAAHFSCKSILRQKSGMILCTLWKTASVGPSTCLKGKTALKSWRKRLAALTLFRLVCVMIEDPLMHCDKFWILWSAMLNIHVELLQLYLLINLWGFNVKSPRVSQYGVFTTQFSPIECQRASVNIFYQCGLNLSGHIRCSIYFSRQV